MNKCSVNIIYFNFLVKYLINFNSNSTQLLELRTIYKKVLAEDSRFKTRRFSQIKHLFNIFLKNKAALIIEKFFYAD